MPDRAKISKAFPRCYQTVWEKIENDQPIVSISESAVDAVKSDIKSNGHGSDEFIDKLGNRLKIFQDNSLMHQMVDWDDEYEKLQHIREQITGNEIALECVERAGCKLLVNLEQGLKFSNIDMELRIGFEKEFLTTRFFLPFGANDEQKALYNQCNNQISKMLRESYEGRKYLIKNAEDGDLTKWSFE